jgi:hypothetical protein
MLKFTKRRGFVLLGVIAALVVAAAAIAYWTAGGSGTGTASTSNGTGSLTINQTSPLTAMYPGDSPQTLSGDFDNPTGNLVQVAQVAVSISSVTKAGNPVVGCDASDYTITGSPMTVGAEVPAGSNTGSWSGATIQFNDKPTVNQDACKGATVNLSYTAS